MISKFFDCDGDVKGTALYELYLTLKQRAILALSQLNSVDHSKEVGIKYNIYNNIGFF
jgi:hypothetical protein